MAINFCGIPLRAHPHPTATLLPWISQTLVQRRTKIFLTFGILFILFTSLFSFFYEPAFFHTPTNQDLTLWRSRKSIDPILVDTSLLATATSYRSRKSDIIPDRSDLSYGVVIDCGSSGSRAFIYSWKRHSGDVKDLLQIKQLVRDNKPVVMKITPGVSTYANTPNRVGPYLRPLLNFVKEEIPVYKHKDTQLYVLCTAGMRMLTKKHQGLILGKIQETIHRLTYFQFSDSHVEVISGMTEGLYFWLGVNYMFGNLQQFHHPVQNNEIDRSPTYGVLDMGGGSLQIAFEVDEDVQELYPKHVLEIDVGCTDRSHGHAYKVFLDTFLHKGANAIRNVYEKDLVADYVNSFNFSNSGSNLSHYISDPCLPNGFLQPVTSHSIYQDSVTVMLNGTGKFDSCKKQLIPHLEKSMCEKSSDRSCIINSRMSPHINFDRQKFIGMSEFFYCMDDILKISGPYNKFLYESKASEFCSTPWNVSWERYKSGAYRYNADNNRMKMQCFKSAWVSTVLHEGFNFPDHYKGLTSVQHINGTEVHWSWGAILYKTRFLPLLEIQRQAITDKENVIAKYKFYPVAFLAHSGVYLFICIAIAVLYLLLSLIKFCVHSWAIKRQTLKRVGTSFAHLLHEDV